MTSGKRPGRRPLAREAAKLRAKPGWDPNRIQSHGLQERLKENIARSQTASAYEGTEQCDACAAKRAETGDSEALCATHMRQALGF